MMKCNQCEATMINGVFCHEMGCPNSHKIWDADTETWTEVYQCDICGYDVAMGNPCSCYEEEDGILA